MTEIASINAYTPYDLDPSFPILAGGNRFERGMELLKKPKTIKKVAKDTYTVKSQMGFATYVVTLGETPTCTCPDYMTNGGHICKHIIAVQEKYKIVDTTWTDYNLAQTTEGATFPELLKELASMVEEPKKESKRGRPSIPLSDEIFCAVTKLYEGKSTRRAQSAITAAEEKNLTQSHHFNTATKFLNREDATPILTELVRISALPLVQLEHEFAIDSSGFRTTVYGDWCNKKHNNKRERTFLKCHICSGVYSNIISDVVITPEEGEGTADMVNFENVLGGTAQRFKVDKIYADKGYLSDNNYAKAVALGAEPYILFKKNSRANGCKAWNDAFRSLLAKPDEWLANFNKRANVESTFGALKVKFGEILKSKNYRAQVNELLCKIIAYNITVLIEMAIKDNVSINFKE